MSDLIKREDAIKAIEELPNAYNGWSDAYDKAYIIGALEEVPSADRPQGEWIEHEGKTIVMDNNFVDFFPTEYECSNCGLRQATYFINSTLPNFCPNCGARMFAKDTNVPNKKGANR